MILYYTIQWGYNKSYSIEGKDLIRAMYAKMSNSVFAQDDFMIEGNLIQVIHPNFAKTAGWNETYKITPEDEEFLRNRYADKFRGKIGLAKDYCNFCLKENRKPDFEIPLKEVRAALGGEHSQFASQLGAQFKLS
jgi:hypothetical protein